MKKNEKDVFSVYLPIGIVEIIDKRARQHFLSRSKQIQFDLLNYYLQIEYLKPNDKDKTNE